MMDIRLYLSFGQSEGRKLCRCLLQFHSSLLVASNKVNQGTAMGKSGALVDEVVARGSVGVCIVDCEHLETDQLVKL